MKRLAAILLTALVAAGLPANVSAQDDMYQRSGTEREKHAQAIFSGVFGQCRDEVSSETNGLVAIVFSIGESGKFGATSTFKADEGETAIRDLARCMGDRANQARKFPKSSEKSIIGVKFRVANDGELLMLDDGVAETLRDGEVFTWARKSPQS